MFTLESGFKKLQIRMLDSPDTCGRKPYPEKPVPGSQIVGRARKSGEDANVKSARKAGRGGAGRKEVPPVFFRVRHFLNFEDSTISELGTGYIRKEKRADSKISGYV